MQTNCRDCGSHIEPNDDAGICIQCGGRNLRTFESYCCQRCGEPVGWLGRALEWFFGRMHDCRGAK